MNDAGLRESGDLILCFLGVFEARECVGYLQGHPEKSPHEAVKMKFKLERRPQDVGNAVTMVCWLWQIAYTDWSWLIGEAVCSVGHGAGGPGLSKPFETQVILPWVPDVRHWASEFAISATGFKSWSDSTFPCHASMTLRREYLFCVTEYLSV